MRSCCLVQRFGFSPSRPLPCPVVSMEIGLATAVKDTPYLECRKLPISPASIPSDPRGQCDVPAKGLAPWWRNSHKELSGEPGTNQQ